jgi:flagellar biosynthesis/type III secretory pathway ATPase
VALLRDRWSVAGDHLLLDQAVVVIAPHDTTRHDTTRANKHAMRIAERW